MNLVGDLDVCMVVGEQLVVDYSCSVAQLSVVFDTPGNAGSRRLSHHHTSTNSEQSTTGTVSIKKLRSARLYGVEECTDEKGAIYYTNYY